MGTDYYSGLAVGVRLSEVGEIVLTKTEITLYDRNTGQPYQKEKIKKTLHIGTVELPIVNAVVDYEDKIGGLAIFMPFFGGKDVQEIYNRGILGVSVGRAQSWGEEAWFKTLNWADLLSGLKECKAKLKSLGIDITPTPFVILQISY